jgi:membrane protein involved in colicin uptake
VAKTKAYHEANKDKAEAYRKANKEKINAKARAKADAKRSAKRGGGLHPHLLHKGDTEISMP